MGLTRFVPPKRQSSESAERPCILCVEDEDTNWEALELALRGSFRLLRAATARDTFSVLRNGKYDMILMDIQLSGSELDGIDITKILKGLHPGPIPPWAQGVRADIPIVFVTAYEARYRRDELRDAGGDELITKPINATRLKLVMSRLLVRQVVESLH